MYRLFGNSPRLRLLRPWACIASRWAEAPDVAVEVGAAVVEERHHRLTRALEIRRQRRQQAAEAAEADVAVVEADVVAQREPVAPQVVLLRPTLRLLPQLSAVVVEADVVAQLLCLRVNTPYGSL